MRAARRLQVLTELARLEPMRDVAAHWRYGLRGVPLELVLDRSTSASASRGRQAPEASSSP